MSDFVVALGLVMVIEGVIYAVFPASLQRVMVTALGMPASTPSA